MDKPSHHNAPANAASTLAPAASSPALPPLLLCIDALAYNWLITASTTRVDLYPIAAANSDCPLELEHPIVAFAGPRALEVPPIEGLLINAVLRRACPDHTFTLTSARRIATSVHSVESQIHRIADFSQLELQDQLELFGQSELVLQGLSRPALQAYIAMLCQSRLGAYIPTLMAPQRFGHLNAIRPASWKAVREALLRARNATQLPGDLPELDSL